MLHALFAAMLLPGTLCTVESGSTTKLRGCEPRVSLLTAEIDRLNLRVRTLESDRQELKPEANFVSAEGVNYLPAFAVQSDAGRTLGKRNGHRRREERDGTSSYSPRRFVAMVRD